MIKQTAITLGLMMAAGTAFAGSAGADASASAEVAFGQSFTELDANGDGQVSWSEAEAGGISKTAFQSAETTQDGSLSMAEYDAAVSAKDGVVGEAVEIGEDTAAGAESMGDDAMDMSNDAMNSAGDTDSMNHDMDSMDSNDMGSMSGGMKDENAGDGNEWNDEMGGTGGPGDAEEADPDVDAGEVFGTTEAEAHGDLGTDTEPGVE